MGNARLRRRDPDRIRSWKELAERVERIGFLPLFRNEVEGFSVEEKTSAAFWWTGDPAEDPWEWREIIAADRKIAYGKFFDGKAGFISREWLPKFVNFRRNGYDFDARWQDGLASRREKKIMDFYIGEDGNGDTVFRDDLILATDLKKKAGFGKGGEKNFPGILTGLQMQLYLVIAGFRRRENKRGEQYGMAVSIPFPPETIWGYEAVTSAYREDPAESRRKIIEHVRGLYQGADEADIVRLIGK